MAHWRGEQGLAWSFWVNLVLLRALLLLGQGALLPHGADAPRQVAAALLALAHGAVLLWQIVGTLRAAERFVADRGGQHVGWGVQLACIVALLMSLSAAARGWQVISAPPPPDENFAERNDRERAALYTLDLSADGRRITLDGEIVYGVAGAFAALRPRAAPGAVLHLSSGGGNVYEARGLARLIAPLDTFVGRDCLSACTLVFIAGRRRLMARGARLGFHQYRVDADYDVPFADTAAEQARDRAIFLDAGVAPWFVDRLYARPPGEMWFPDPATLLRAGVVHEVLPEASS